jgi:hypothetical protein
LATLKKRCGLPWRRSINEIVRERHLERLSNEPEIPLHPSTAQQHGEEERRHRILLTRN